MQEQLAFAHGRKFGLVLGTRRFRNLVGAGLAFSILGTARSFDANEELAIRFVTSVVSQDELPALQQLAHKSAEALDDLTRAYLHQALNVNEGDTDMVEQVRSASQPGFKSRIRAYLSS